MVLPPTIVTLLIVHVGLPGVLLTTTLFLTPEIVMVSPFASPVLVPLTVMVGTRLCSW